MTMNCGMPGMPAGSGAAGTPAGAAAPSPDPETGLPKAPVEEAEGDQHAFILAGSRTLFAVHMTMFAMEAHSYQLVLEIDLAPEDRQRLETARRAAPGTTFFLGNCADDLMLVPDLQSRVRQSFRADFYRGLPWAPSYAFWPWRGLRPALGEVPVQVRRVVWFRKFDFNLARPRSPGYLLFGDGDEAHLHNLQIAPPEYDHVVSLARAPDWLPQSHLRAGMPVNFPDLAACREGCDGPVPCQDPLPPGFHYAQYRGLPERYPLEVKHSLWFSTKVVNPDDPCKAEDTVPPKEPIP